jgi:TonB-linked SusC/RagA family outer membrane protein
MPVLLRQPITLSLKNVRTEQALKTIASRAGISLTYSRAVVPLDRTVSVDLQSGSVLEALQQVLGNTNVELWVSAEGRMALVPAERVAAESEPDMAGTVAGQVTERETGQPLPGVTITVGGTRASATTTETGQYTVGNVPDGQHWLYAQRLGFARDSQQVTVAGGPATANFSMRRVAVRLDEVVSIGYGTTTRREVTTAISSMSSDDISKSPAPSIEQLLQGRTAGVQVTVSSGAPGTTSAVRVRGGNSISAGNDPLYVVDGVPIQATPANTSTLSSEGMSGLNPLATLNPQDVESVDVLKDASATAIYGARAANGVILITTKRGLSGTNHWSLGAYYASQEVRHKLDLLNAQEFATNANLARTNAGQSPLYTATEIAALPNTNWQDQIFRSAPTVNYELSFSGGDTVTRYFLSGNLLKQEGVIINTNLDRGAARLNLDRTVGQRFRMGSRFTFSRSQGQVMPNGGAGQDVSSVLLNALTAPPTLPVHTATGEYWIGLNDANGRLFANPVASAAMMTNYETQNRLLGNGFAEVDLRDNLVLRSSLGADYLTSIQDFYSPTTTYPGIVRGGYGSRGSLSATTWLNENTLRFTPGSIGMFRGVEVLGGLTLQKQDQENVSGTAQDFATDALGVNGLNSGTTFNGVWTGAPHSSLLSYFARANWNFSDRYLFTVTSRVDGSSKFGSANRYGSFPSAAFAWRVSDEPFFKGVSFVNDLKVRLSVGRTGNQDIGDYRSLATLQSSTYFLNGTKVTGYSPATLPNPNLKWETTDETNLGVDAGFLHSRVLLTADFYNRKTNDLLYEVAVPATLGVRSQLQNIGNVRNKGLELSVNTVNLVGRLQWTSALNMAWNRNEVLSIGTDTIAVGPVGVGSGANQNPTVIKVGEPLNSFYGYVYAGMSPQGQPTYADLNGDGQTNTADQRIIGNAQPNYTGGLNNDFSYGPFDLSVLFQFSAGNKIYDINRAMLTNNAGNANQLRDVLKAGNEGADGIPKPMIGNSYDTRPSTLFVEDGAYLRGKNVQLSYRLPNHVLAKARIGNLHDARLYVSMQNFFTKTSYTGFDPEVTAYATSVLAQGIDFGTYPQTRQFTIGFRAGY